MPTCNSVTNHNPADLRSNSKQSEDTSQHPIQHQNTYGWLTTSVFGLFQWFFLTMLRLLVAAIIMALGDRQTIVDGREQQASVDIANDIPRAPGTSQHDSFNPTLPNISESRTSSVATQFQGAQGVNITGHPRFTNIGNVTTVNNYDGTHGLEKLERFVSFAALHDSSEQDPNRHCHPGTRKNVLNQLRDWIDNPITTDRMSWLHGPAGAGKSAIAQTVAHAYEHGEVAATFFFYRSDPSRNDGNRLFPTIAWQLAFSIPATKDFIVHTLDKTPHLPTKGVEFQFEQLVVHTFHPTNNISSQIPQPVPVIIIDGLDECSDEQLQRRILAVIGNAVKDYRVPLRFLICSRPEALIEETLDQFKDFTLRIDLATLGDSNRDIEKYLVNQFSDIASKRGLDPVWPGQQIIKEFVFKSSGNFIFAATVMRYISDEDYNPEDQLDIVRNLKPHGKVSPFALLDELYLEILKQQRDQDLLKTFLALLIGRSSVNEDNLHEDDTMLMNISKKDLHVKLRRMRSLLKFEPFIDVHHQSFLDFLEDPSRSGEYHVSKQGGQRRYLELIVDCVIRHVYKAIEQPNVHEICRSSPKFQYIVEAYPPMILLPIKYWQEALKPLLNLQHILFNTLKPQLCHIFQVMRNLLLHLVILQGNSHHIAAAQVSDSNMNEIDAERSPTPVTEAGQNIFEQDLDRCLFVLLSCLQKTNSVLVVNTVIIERMSSLLVFDYIKIAARIQSVTDAQKLIDVIDSLINNQSFLSQCGRDAARKAALLASEIFARAPLLPQSVFFNGPTQQCIWLLKSRLRGIDLVCQSAFISRILDHNYILPTWWIYQGDELKFVYGNANAQNESVHMWLKRSRPDFVTRIQAMLGVARTIRYVHSMDVVGTLSSRAIRSRNIVLDSNLRARIVFFGLFAWQIRENLIYDLDYFTYESHISAFVDLFHSVCFDGVNENLPNHLVENARQLIGRCTADLESRPTMESIVKEMETWNLT